MIYFANKKCEDVYKTLGNHCTTPGSTFVSKDGSIIVMVVNGSQAVVLVGGLSYSPLVNFSVSTLYRRVDLNLSIKE